MPTAGIAKRGAIYYKLPEKVKKLTMVKTKPLKYLMEVIGLLTQERDAVAKVRNETVAGNGSRVKQINGYSNASEAATLTSIDSDIQYDAPVLADTVNSIINFVNNLSHTVGGTATVTVSTTCDWTANVELIKVKELPIINCPLSQIDPQGQIDLNTDYTAYYDVCNNLGQECSHKKKLFNWVRHGSTSNKGYTWICTNTIRTKQKEVSNGIGKPNMSTVNKGERILAQTFNDIIEYVHLISAGLDSDEYVQGDNGGTIFNHYGYCKRMCQLACQTSCQLACQTCYGGTCYNVYFTF